jgi:hypothetical protein
VELSLEDRRMRLGEMFRASDRRSVEGEQFRYLLRFAHEEGRLREFLQEVEALDPQGSYRPYSAAPNEREERKIPSSSEPLLDHSHPRSARGWMSPRSMFGRFSWLISQLKRQRYHPLPRTSLFVRDETVSSRILEKKTAPPPEVKAGPPILANGGEGSEKERALTVLRWGAL